MMDPDEGVKTRFMARMDRFLTRADDRALFGLPPRAQETTALVYLALPRQLTVG
jgi:hypothetical protein